jgi:hypothetical protein
LAPFSKGFDLVSQGAPKGGVVQVGVKVLEEEDSGFGAGCFQVPEGRHRILCAGDRARSVALLVKPLGGSPPKGGHLPFSTESTQAAFNPVLLVAEQVNKGVSGAIEFAYFLKNSFHGALG